MYQALHEGEHHDDVGVALRSVGLAYERLGKYTQALEYHQQALKMYQGLHEREHHADVAAVLRSVGLAYERLGKYTQALEYYQQALKMYQEVHEKKDHADVARNLRNVGIAYKNLGNHAQALEYYQQALAMYQALHEGEHHADIAAALRSVGLAHQNLSKYTEALEYYQKALEMRKALYKGDHADVAQVLNDVGVAYERLGKDTQALEYYQQALAIYQEVHEKKDHADVARNLRNVGLAYHNLGNHAQALEYYQKALAMQQALHEGEHHADVAATLRSIGLAYERLGKDTEALEYHQQALAMYQALHEGEHHADVAAALRSVGLAHQNLSKYTEALEYYQQALAMRKGLYEEENHAQVALVLKDVGDAYKGLGQHAQALEYYQQALAMQQALHEGEHHDDVAAALRSVGLAHQNLGDHAQALEYHQQALAMYQALHEGEHHADVAAALRSVGLAHQNLGLRNYYKDPTFACVPSLFDGQPPKHVKDLECQLMLFEQKLVKQDKAKEAAGGQEDHIAQHQERRLEWVKTPIAFQDLFKKRSTKPGDTEKEIQQVLLAGDPGTGKTALSRQLAYQWSEGLWGQEFHTLYLLPVISLQQSEYDGTHYNRENTLATAIVNTCFAHDLPTTEAEYTSLRDHIDQELKKPTTLVILDGLDERAGASEEILRQAQAGSHKLLMLSRLYGIETERRTIEIQIEHVGFNPEQLERYVRQEVSDGKLAEALLGYIHKHENIRSIAHVPVNLQILCALWQGEEYRLSEEELQQGSLAGLYDRFTGYIWKRYVTERKFPDRNADKVALFNALGQIALQALEQGQALIDFKLVDDVLERAAFDGGLKARLRAVGFLLLKYVDKDSVEPRYEFPHLTFQEYFAGRALAQQFLSEGKGEQAALGKLVSKHKYKGSYGRTLTFMAGEVSRVKRASGIEQLLGLLEQEKEVVGLQHLRLQLRVLQEWLCSAGEDAADELAELERGSQVLASLESGLFEPSRTYG